MGPTDLLTKQLGDTLYIGQAIRISYRVRKTSHTLLRRTRSNALGCGMQTFKVLLILVFVSATAISPWLFHFLAPLSGKAATIALAIMFLAAIVFILDLVFTKFIDKTLGQPMNQTTVESSFSFRRVCYLLFVYASIVITVLGLLALLNSR